MNWFGWTVKADIPDPDGMPCAHPHPAMVLRGPGADGGLWLIAISTQFDRPNTNPYWIECDWATGGHPLTGLDRPCVLKCDWVVRFNRKNLIDFLGEIDQATASLASDLVLECFRNRRG